MNIFDATLTRWRIKGLHRFVDYFVKTWLEENPGWWPGYLGERTPPTDNGLEGTWPSLGKFVKQGGPITMLNSLKEEIIPSFIENRKPMSTDLKSLSAKERQAAVRLTRDTANVVSDEGFYYVKRHSECGLR